MRTSRSKACLAAVGVLGAVCATSLASSQPAAAAQLSIEYTGPEQAQYRAPTQLSAVIRADGAALSGAKVTFVLGGESCTATSGGDGSAACALKPGGKPGWSGLTIRAESDAGRVGTTASFEVTKADTHLKYTGTQYIANDEPARLEASLKDGAKQAVGDRKVRFVLGSGEHKQSCTGTTSSSGTAACTVDKVDQPLNDKGTVPVSAVYEGDDYYNASDDSATILLQYATGRSYGAAAKIDLPLLPVSLPPQPDTGQIRTARATRTTPPCTAEVRTLVLDADAVCAQVITSLAPGTSRATATATRGEIALLGLPLVEFSGLEAESTSTCEKATGRTGLTLKIAGKTVPVPDTPNTEIDLGAARLVVNEQLPVEGADYGLTVNALHLKDATGLIDVVVGSATSDAHNCKPKEEQR